MSFKTKVVTGLIAATAVAGIGAATAGAASAAPLRAATGSVALSAPLQYEQFVAVQGHGPWHGAINYTNFTYAEPGSGVWVPAGETLPAQTTLADTALSFQVNGTGPAYVHTLNGGMVLKADSPSKVEFSGTGEYSSPGYPWTIQGQVSGHNVSFRIDYQGAINPGYNVEATGTIAADGSVSGTAVSHLLNENAIDQHLTWTMPAGSFVSVLHFVTGVRAVQVSPRADNATFRFTVPATGPFAVPAPLGGTRVTVKVHDNDLPGNAGDTYAHGVTGGPLSSYPVTGGPGITITP